MPPEGSGLPSPLDIFNSTLVFSENVESPGLHQTPANTTPMFPENLDGSSLSSDSCCFSAKNENKTYGCMVVLFYPG